MVCIMLPDFKRHSYGFVYDVGLAQLPANIWLRRRHRGRRQCQLWGDVTTTGVHGVDLNVGKL